MPRRLLAAPDRTAPRLLVGVRSVAEAVEAADAGADLVDAKDPDGAALGALSPDRVRAIAEAARDRAFVSAAAGQAGGMSDLVTRLRVVAACGVDMARVALPPALAADPDLERACQPLRALATPAVAVLFAEDDPDPLWLPGLARAGFAGAISVPAQALTAFLRAVAEATLAAGFAHVCLINNHLEPAHDAAVRAAVAGSGSRGVSEAPAARDTP